MIVTFCDGCLQRIADDDPAAARGVPVDTRTVDWCGRCAKTHRPELQRVVDTTLAGMRAARRGELTQRHAERAESVRDRARDLWRGRGGEVVGGRYTLLRRR